MTTEQLLDKIAKDLCWRHKELTELKALISEIDPQNELRSKVIIRSALPLLYAHWEGFVKTCSSCYLEYVASHRLPYRKLTTNFVGLKLRGKFDELSKNSMLSAGNAIADFFLTELDNPSSIPCKGIVNTKSNLSSIVLSDILNTLGLDPSIFAIYKDCIDKKLLNRRNHIAHGHGEIPDECSPEDFLWLYKQVLNLIEIYRNQVEDAAVKRLFERQ